MRAGSKAALVAAALVAYVFLSSWLGLAGRFLIFEPRGTFAFMASIWQASVVADAAFVAGSVTAALVSVRVARQSGLGFGFAAALALSYLTYLVSFLLLPGSVKGGVDEGTFYAVWFVASWGFPGLILATLAPPLAARWWAQREDATPMDAPDSRAT